MKEYVVVRDPFSSGLLKHDAPNRIYKNYDEAVAAAGTLADFYKGTTFYVAELVAAFKSQWPQESRG